jgi:hypothetical protein
VSAESRKSSFLESPLPKAPICCQSSQEETARGAAGFVSGAAKLDDLSADDAFSGAPTAFFGSDAVAPAI